MSKQAVHGMGDGIQRNWIDLQTKREALIEQMKILGYMD